MSTHRLTKLIFSLALLAGSFLLPSIAPAFAYTTGSVTRTTYNDFNNSSATKTNVEAVNNSGGEVALKSSFRDDFEDNTLSSIKWTYGSPTVGSVYTPILSNGRLTLTGTDGAYIIGNTSFINKTLEFRANFSHITEFLGWASGVSPDKFTWFRTLNNTQFYTQVSGEGFLHNLGSYWPDGYHLFKIAWTDSDIAFYIDGDLVGTDNTMTTPLKPIAMTGQDYVSGSGNSVTGSQVLLDWINVLDYPNTAGEYISESIDSGNANTVWDALTFNAETPSGTSVTLYTRTSPDNITWSAWSASLHSEDTIPSPSGRYIQYKAVLNGTSTTTPLLDDVLISYKVSEPPVVSILSPENNTVVKRNKITTISASAYSPDNYPITKIEYSIDSTLLCSVTPGVNCDWKVPTGKPDKFFIQVKAYDSLGNSSTSQTSVTTSKNQ